MLKSMLTIVGFLGAAAVSYASLTLLQDNDLLKQQVADHTRIKEQLLLEVENSTRRRLEFEQQIANLQDNVLSSASEISHLSDQLKLTKAMVNPQYQEIESTIRRQFEIEYRQYQQELEERTTQSNTPAAIIRNLSALEETERRAVIQVEGQFADVINKLDVSEEKRQAVVGVLVQFTADRNIERENIAASDIPREEMRTQMQALFNPEILTTSLSAVLDEGEIAQFQELQNEYGMSMRQRGGDRSRRFQRGAANGGDSPFRLRNPPQQAPRRDQ